MNNIYHKNDICFYCNNRMVMITNCCLKKRNFLMEKMQNIKHFFLATFNIIPIILHFVKAIKIDKSWK